MSIRTKCALLVLGFEATLCLTLFFTVRQIGAYFDDAARTFQSSNTGLVSISRVRTLVRNQLVHLVRFVDHPTERTECERLNREIVAAVLSLQPAIQQTLGSDRWALLDDLVKRQRAATAAFLEPTTAQQARPAARFDPQAHLSLDAQLGQIESGMLSAAAARVDDAFAAQRRATLFLWANAIVGVVLGVLGLFLVRRWVLLPIRELERTTDELGRGNLEHRAKIATGGEFGRLAEAVNKMSADLARIERQLVQRERLAAMGELISYIAHNIRNPLAGIQAAAQASQGQLSADSPVRRHQETIVSAIDKFQSWLRQLEHTCSPLELRPERVELARLVDNVAAVFRPMSDRRGLFVETRMSPLIRTVHVDPGHFEHALAAVVGNAIEASGDGMRILIGSETNGDGAHWTLFVKDNGPGIAAEALDRVFEPTYSTKRSGHGLGLAMAKKIVEMHGGQIRAERPADGGALLRIAMPTNPPTRKVNG
jgi:signal transduction histidine kinase